MVRQLLEYCEQNSLLPHCAGPNLMDVCQCKSSSSILIFLSTNCDSERLYYASALLLYSITILYSMFNGNSDTAQVGQINQ